jgi:hypothetical protein
MDKDCVRMSKGSNLMTNDSMLMTDDNILMTNEGILMRARMRGVVGIMTAVIEKLSAV